jgi:hypothetical protein
MLLGVWQVSFRRECNPDSGEMNPCLDLVVVGTDLVRAQPEPLLRAGMAAG